MTDMVPTTRLRFVERMSPPRQFPLKILQQWWEKPSLFPGASGNEGEWRDVPLESE